MAENKLVSAWKMKVRLLVAILFFCQRPSAVPADVRELKFEEYFQKQKEIRLSTEGLRIAYLWMLGTDNAGKLFFLDARGCQLIVFDNDGRYTARIGGRGQGPGEFMAPHSVFVDTNHIHVFDSQTRRLNTYMPDGKFLKSFTITSNHGPGEIVMDSNENAYVGGLSLPSEPESRGDWLNEYDNQGKFVRSFFKDNSGKNWIFRMRPNFVFDIYEDLIFAMQINKYEIQVFNSGGDLVSSINHPPDYFRPPDERYILDPKKYHTVEQFRDELYRLMASWTRIIRLDVIEPGNIIVMCAANGLVRDCSMKYLIDLWSTKGALLATGIPTDFPLLCADKRGNCYFLIRTNQDEALNKDPEYVIGKYRCLVPVK